MSRHAKPLEGLVLVEALSPNAPPALHYASGLCGRIAADLGAEVTRIVSCNSPASPSPTDLFLHIGKRNLRLDQDKSVALVAALADKAGAMVLDGPTFATLSPQPLAVSVVLGMTRDAPNEGSEFSVEALSGLLDIVGDPEREPLRLGGHQIAYAAGLACYLAMVSALNARREERPSRPLYVDLLDVAVWLNWKMLGMAERAEAPQHRAGDKGEWHVAACADGYVAIVYRAAEWSRLVEATADSQLKDPRFHSVAGRHQHRAELNNILADIFSNKTRAAIMALAVERKLPLGPVWTPAELIDNPHMVSRAAFDWISLADRRVAVARVPVKWNGSGFPVAHSETSTALTAGAAQ